MASPNGPTWPADSRTQLWAPRFSDMHPIIDALEIPDTLPVNTARLFETARELLRFSYYRYEFAALAVTTSLIAVEAAFSERYGERRTLAQMITLATDGGTISAEQADVLNTGRSIRNRYAHGKDMHPALPIPVATRMISVSLELITVLQAAPTGS